MLTVAAVATDEPDVGEKSVMPYLQVVKMLADFLPIEPSETHTSVRKRTIGSASGSTTRSCGNMAREV